MIKKYKLYPFFFVVFATLSMGLKGYAVENVYRLHNYTGSIKSASERAELLDRLGREAIVEVLKKLLPQDEERMLALIASEIPSATVVRSIEVVDEKRTSGNYSLTVNVTLERDPIRSAILRRAVPYTDMRPASVAVIPLWQEGRTLYPASSATDWRRTLDGFNGAPTLFTYSVVTPELLKKAGVKNDLFKLGAADVLDEIAALAGTDQAVVFFADHNLSEDVVNLSVFSNSPDISREQTLFASSEGLEKMAKTAFLGYEAAYRNSRLMRPEDENNFLLRYKAHSVSDVQKVEETLKNASFIQQVGIRLMSQDETVFVINMQSDFETLGNYMKRFGYELGDTNIRNVWRLGKAEE